jgi:peptide/nickel transport system substrate-binding protein
MRYALATALDRAAICSTAFYNNAKPASGFFPPYFKDTDAVQTLQNSSNLQITVENLEKIGYNRLNEVGYRINSVGTPLTFTLLVNRENRSRALAARLIAEQMASSGISIKVLERSAADYNAAISSGNFQLYLGEMRMLGNMDISSLVIPGGSAAFGVVDSRIIETPITDPAAPPPEPQTVSPITDAINAFYSGNSSIADVAGVLLTEMPVIPICFRNGLLFCDNSLGSTEGKISASRSDIFLSAEDWICKINK